MTQDSGKPDRSIPRFGVFWWGFWLAVILIANKALLLHTVGDYSRLQILLHPIGILTPTYQDTAYVAALMAVGQLGIFLCRRWLRVRWCVWVAYLGVCFASVLFSVCSYWIFQFSLAPLTVGILRSAGSAAMIGSSVTPYLSPSRVAILLLIPAAYAALCVVSSRYLGPHRLAREVWLVAIACVAASLSWMYGNHELRTEQWSMNGDRLVAMGPHWTLIASALAELKNPRSVVLADQFPATYLGDFASSPVTPSRPPPHAWKNAIVVILESTAAERMSVYGSPYDTTPELRSEEKNSLIFDNFYSPAGQSMQSLIALTTSCYPQFRAGHPKPRGAVKSETFSCARVLHDHGYRTAFITSTSFAFHDDLLREQCFDTIADSRNLNCPMLFSWGVKDHCAFDFLLQWIQQDSRRPFFAIVWTIQTHHPYLPTPGNNPIQFVQSDGSEDAEALNRHLNALRDGDREIARLFAALRASRLDDDTLVIITGDHGESFHDLHGHRFHGFDLFQEDVRVPLIIWNPKLASRGSRLDTIAGHIDIGPTILDLLGFDSRIGCQGRSLFDPNRPPRTYFFANKGYLLLGMRTMNWKYIYNTVTAKEQLFDLQSDPHEQTDIAASHEQLCRDLRRYISAWARSQATH